MTQAICDITTDEVNVDVVVEPQADTMVEVANRAGGMEQVFHDNTLIGNGNSIDLGVNTDLIATKEYVDEKVESIDTYTKDQIDGKLTAVDAQIDANADAIQKTREDYIQADSEIHQILNAHASELTTHRNDIDGLGDQVSAIEEKIPETASAENPLVTRSEISSVYKFKGSVATYNDLPTGATVGDVYNVTDTGANYAWDGSAWDKLSETVDLSSYATTAYVNAREQDIRDNYMQADSELQTQINGQATTISGIQDDITGINSKISTSASSTNKLVSASELSATEQDIRADMNEADSQLQTQITAQAAEIATKQDQLVAGDNIVISNNVISATGAGGGAGFDIVVVQELPATGQKGIIYLLAKDGAAPDVYDEYVWIESTQTFELIGTTQVDLTDYVKKTDYATSSKGGVFKTSSSSYATSVTGAGFLSATSKSLSAYNDAQPTIFISKGTLENIKDDLVARAIENTVNTQNLTVGSGEGTLYVGDVAGTATIATNNGLDIAAQTKFDTAPTTDDTTTWANALDANLVSKAQVASALSELPTGANLPILMSVWSDHLLNNMSWLRADTFSWQSGDVNKAAYEHLAEDAAGVEVLYAFRGSGNPTIGDNIAVSTVYAKTETVSVGSTVYLDTNMSVSSTVASVSGNTITSIASVSGYDFPFPDGYVRNSAYDYMSGSKTDTIGDITITYYQAQDGHKICLPDQESNISEMYETTGAADYYILDSTNKQFKLPRNYQPKRTLIRTANNADGTWYNLYSDGWVEQGGQIIRGVITFAIPMADLNYTVSGAQIRSGSTNGTYYNAYKFVNMRETGIDLDNAQSEDPLIAWSVSGYAAESAYASAGMRLEYYYVGNFERSALEQAAGITAETLNSKADADLGNVPNNYDYVVESQLPTADNGYTWYRKYKSGWVEQGGGCTVPVTNGVSSSSVTVTLPVPIAAPEQATLTYNGMDSTGYYANCEDQASVTTTTVTIGRWNNGSPAADARYYNWNLSGMSAQ